MKKIRLFVSHTKNFTVNVFTNNSVSIYSRLLKKPIFETTFDFKIFSVKTTDFILLAGITEVVLITAFENQFKIFQTKIPQKIHDILIAGKKYFCSSLHKLWELQPSKNNCLKFKEIEKYQSIGGVFCCKLFALKEQPIILRGTSNSRIFLNKIELKTPEIHNSIIYDLHLQISEGSLNGSKLLVATESRQLILYELNKYSLQQINKFTHEKQRFLRCGLFFNSKFYGITEKNIIYFIDDQKALKLFESDCLVTSVVFKSKFTNILTKKGEYKFSVENKLGVKIKRENTSKYHVRDALIDLVEETVEGPVTCIIKVQNYFIFYAMRHKLFFNKIFISNENSSILLHEMSENIKYLSELCDEYILITTISNKYFRLHIQTHELQFIGQSKENVVRINCGLICTKDNSFIKFVCQKGMKFSSRKYNFEIKNQKIMQCETRNRKTLILFERRLVIFDTKLIQQIAFRRNLKGYFRLNKKEVGINKFLKDLVVFGFEKGEIFVQSVCTKAILKIKTEGFFSGWKFEKGILTVFDFVKGVRLDLTGLEELKWVWGGEIRVFEDESVIYGRSHQSPLKTKEKEKIGKTNNFSLSLKNRFDTFIFKEEFNGEIYDFKFNEQNLVVSLKTKELMFYRIYANLLCFKKTIKLPQHVKSICLTPTNKLFLGFVTGQILETEISVSSIESIESLEVFNFSKIFEFQNFCWILGNDGFLRKKGLAVKMHKSSIKGFCLNGSILYTIGDDHQISSVDLNLLIQKDTFKVKTVLAHSAPIKSIKLQNGIIETVSFDGFLKLWSLELEFLEAIFKD